MKKLIALALSTMLVLVACGEIEEDEPTSQSEPTETVPADSTDFSTHTTPNGVVVECGNFGGDIECWVLSYP